MESTGESFTEEKLIGAQRLAKKAVLLFAQHIRPGMELTEAEGLLEEIFKLLKVDKRWHQSKIRFGEDTVKSFKQKSDPRSSLKKEDIYFVDIGPVINNHEGDYGMTFTLGNNPQLAKLQRSSKLVFDYGKQLWRAGPITGQQLYKKLTEYSSSLGLRLNTNARGHRIGDFPHHVHYRGGINELDRVLAPDRWVLEIHLIDDNLNRGSFFEDIL